VRDALALAADAPAEEARALRTLLNGFDADFQLSLDDLAGQAARWRSDGPRPLAGQLARRLLFLKSQPQPAADLARLQACENRSIAGFVRAAP
jgi:hypothetical protein